MIIYVLTNNKNGKKYVGITTVKLQRRWRQHITKPNGIIGNAIKKYGEENFTKEIIETCSSLDELKNREKYWIQELNTLSPNGYNLREGGENNGGFTQEVRDKIKESWVERKKRGVSKETKDKMSKGQKEMLKNNPDFAAKRTAQLENSWKNPYKRSEEQLKKNREQKSRVRVFCLNNGVTYNSLSDAARELGIRPSDIQSTIKGHTHSAKGWVFDIIR